VPERGKAGILLKWANTGGAPIARRRDNVDEDRWSNGGGVEDAEDGAPPRLLVPSLILRE
jgi:hypothetical protein